MDVVPAAATIFALALTAATLVGMYLAYRALYK